MKTWLTPGSSRTARSKLKVKVVYEGPIPAPLAKGRRVATLVLEAPGMDPLTYPLVTGDSVEKLGLFGRLGAAVKYIIWGAEG